MGEVIFWDEDKIPTELINGESIRMLPRPLIVHPEVCASIACILGNALGKGRGEVFTGGVVLELDEKNHFVPDVMIVCDPSQIKEDCIVGAPAFVVEVLSPSTAVRDRGVKMRAYAAAGVQEYWLVDIPGKHIEVYRQQEGQLNIERIYQYYSPEEQAENAAKEEYFRLSDEDMEQSITVDICGGFQVALSDVFNRVLS